MAGAGEKGIYGEAGLKHSWSELSSTYFAVRHGMLGTICICRVKRGSTIIEGNMQIGQDARDWQTAVAAVVVPMVANLIISRCATMTATH